MESVKCALATVIWRAYFKGPPDELNGPETIPWSFKAKILGTSGGKARRHWMHSRGLPGRGPKIALRRKVDIGFCNQNSSPECLFGWRLPFLTFAIHFLLLFPLIFSSRPSTHFSFKHYYPLEQRFRKPDILDYSQSQIILDLEENNFSNECQKRKRDESSRNIDFVSGKICDTELSVNKENSRFTSDLLACY